MSDRKSAEARICLGTAQLGFDYGVANGRGRPDDTVCEAILSRAVERGVLHWDTARAYGDAEERIGSFLAKHPRRDEVQVVSKLSLPPSDLPESDLGDWVTAQTDDSLRRLRVEKIAGWLIHDANACVTHGKAVWDAMQWQVDRGVVAQIGMSINDEPEFSLALDAPQCRAVQFPLNLLDHRAVQSGLASIAAAEKGCTLYARSILLQGTLSMTPSSLPPKLRHLREPLRDLQQLLAENKLTVLDAALPFVLSHHDVSFAVIGVDDAAQLDDNLDRAELLLPDGLAERLRVLSRDLPAEVLEPRRW